MNYANELFVTLFNLEFDKLSEIGFTAFLLLIILFIVSAALRQWVVPGWAYRDLKKRLEETEQRLRIMESLAMRGTEIADELSRRSAEKERDHDQTDS